MPLFAVIGLDHPPRAMAKGDAVRPEHRAYVVSQDAPIRLVGVLLDDVPPGGVADVGGGAAALGLDQTHRLGRALGVHVPHRDARAVAGELERAAAADPPAPRP